MPNVTLTAEDFSHYKEEVNEFAEKHGELIS